MLVLSKVAVTGGLSSGKSSVCRFFKELGAYVVSADEIVHQLLSTTTNLSQEVINLLGQDIVVDDQIDRSKIAEKVFNNPTLLKSLERLLHPAVLNEIQRQYQQIKTSRSASLFVAEIPLLFEINGEKMFDYSIAVMADPKVCKARFKATTGYDEGEYNKRMARQLPLKEKMERADFVIHNSGSLLELKEAVQKIFNKLTQKPYN